MAEVDVGASSETSPTTPVRPFRVRPGDPALAHELGREAGVGPVVAQILLHRGLSDAKAMRDFASPRLDGLTAPDAMIGRSEAAERLADAILRKERIVVFGDYDVDGATSAALLADAIEELGGEVKALLASRFQGGYGLSDAALDRCLALEPSVLVTCDCGSSDHERIARAKAAGVDVLVVDHHLVPKEALPADVFLNPHRQECGFPYKGLCSAGLVFSLAAALRARLGARLDLRSYLDLVALGTVADVAPLDGDNRRLVRAGLALLGRGGGRAGVRALCRQAGLRPGVPVGGPEIAFRLAPRLNAAGRLGDPAITLALLRARSDDEARALAGQIEALNQRRKAIEKEITAQALEAAQAIYGERPQSGVVVAGEGWHPGVLGITAARLVDRFEVPVVVLSIDAGKAQGSGRAPAGFHIHRAFESAATLLDRFGGHAAAAGLSLEAGRIEAFRAAFADASRDVASRPPEPLWADVELGKAFDVPEPEDLGLLEPTGEGNATPLFALHAAVESSRAVGKGEHLKLDLRVGRRRISGFGPRMGHRATDLSTDARIVGRLRPDAYRGGRALEVQIEHLDES